MQAESAIGGGSVLVSPEIGLPLLPMTIYLAKLLLLSSPVPLEVLLTMFFTGSTPETAILERRPPQRTLN